MQPTVATGAEGAWRRPAALMPRRRVGLDRCGNSKSRYDLRFQMKLRAGYPASVVAI